MSSSRKPVYSGSEGTGVDRPVAISCRCAVHVWGPAGPYFWGRFRQLHPRAVLRARHARNTRVRRAVLASSAMGREGAGGGVGMRRSWPRSARGAGGSSASAGRRASSGSPSCCWSAGVLGAVARGRAGSRRALVRRLPRAPGRLRGARAGLRRRRRGAASPPTASAPRRSCASTRPTSSTSRARPSCRSTGAAAASAAATTRPDDRDLDAHRSHAGERATVFTRVLRRGGTALRAVLALLRRVEHDGRRLRRGLGEVLGAAAAAQPRPGHDRLPGLPSRRLGGRAAAARRRRQRLDARQLARSLPGLQAALLPWRLGAEQRLEPRLARQPRRPRADGGARPQGPERRSRSTRAATCASAPRPPRACA